MSLSRSKLGSVTGDVSIPDETVFQLPEKVLQFGTGVLLRCLPDYFIDKANKKGVFNGRIVIVKSTTQGDSNAFQEQDNLYTICVRGKKSGKVYEEDIINASVSRVLSAQEQWSEIIACARNPELKIVISNTTEVGLQYVEEKLVTGKTPVSFPAKLLAFLLERHRSFSGSSESGMIIIPTELISDNGKKLFEIIQRLAVFNNADESFQSWLTNSNHFCSSLVDRIVPGAPDAEFKAKLKAHLGYDDALCAMAEPYALWAIEGDEHIRRVLSFAQVNDAVKIEKDITPFKELKLRLLNGTHSLSCGLAFFAGFETVVEAMEDPVFSVFVERLMVSEIAPSIPYKGKLEGAPEFATLVLDRFANPYIKHKWINITLNYSSKLKERVIPVLLQHYQTHNAPPKLYALGFAAYLLFMRPVKKEGDKYFGEHKGAAYPINDERAALFMEKFGSLKGSDLVRSVLAAKELWGSDLTLLPGFEKAVTDSLDQIDRAGVKSAIGNLLGAGVLK